MRTFILRTMQAMMLFSICILAWLTGQFFSSFIYKPIMKVREELFFCGTVSDEDANATAGGIDGKALFNANCASCHKIDRALTGPALQGVEERWPEKKKLYLWIRNSDLIIKNGDKYANALVKKYGGAKMSQFPNLSDGEIDAILRYINQWQHKVKKLPMP